MTVKTDCRHYIMQSTSSGERTERCAVSANTVLPFSCPEGCLFYEPRKVSPAGWQVAHHPDANPDEGSTDDASRPEGT
ncbi:MAG: hypothetical protein M0008_08705 [Actinomycetota bacterium]|nr:hypothetical protein [Actinomycetota bacterium]